MRRVAVLIAFLLVLVAAIGLAQGQTCFSLAECLSGQTSGLIVQLFGLLTVLAVAPGLLIMLTSFTRFVIAFSFLRSGIGL